MSDHPKVTNSIALTEEARSPLTPSWMSLLAPLALSQKLGCLAPVAQTRFYLFGPSFGRSPVGKVVYDDVDTGWIPVRSPLGRCMYDDLEENPSSTPIEGSVLLKRIPKSQP
ncbi:hypothetical protein NDI44_22445 [Trichocoleus sp. DQ-A3]|uniref:hypothetical protein n=1 Tax=Cyanophyceae TaxID=3028117 RepID=UPI0016835C79|nr:hypothetical protein [Coleofasciculus sp. FACHB-125]MBD1903798.1 hypothetical protein [Coleofasciculus sp. FACHB-125]